MAEVVLLPRAERDLEDIWLTIAADNPKAADKLIERIMAQAARAGQQPGIGSPRPDIAPDARILVEGRYIVIYTPHDGGVTVAAVVHGMRDPENWLG